MKKILLNLGALSIIVVPITSVVSCGSSDDVKVLPAGSTHTSTEAYKDIFKRIDVIAGAFKLDILESSVAKEQLSNFIFKFIKGGLNELTFNDLDDLLKAFKVNEKRKKIIYALFTKVDSKNHNSKAINLKLINMFFNNGLADLENQKNTKTLKNLKLLIDSIMPSKISISDDFKTKILLTGFKTDADFANDVFNIISTIPDLKLFLDNVANQKIMLEKDIKAILVLLYQKLSGVLGHGLFKITASDIKQIISWDGLIDFDIQIFLEKYQTNNSNQLPANVKNIIDKITDGNNTKLDIIRVISNFIAHDEIAPEGWTTFDKIKNIWGFLRTLKGSGSLDTSIKIIPILFQKGLAHLTSQQISQLANIIDFGVDYTVSPVKDALQTLKKALIDAFTGKFADAENNNAINVAELSKAKTAENAVNIAKKITAYNVKTDQKGTRFILDIEDIIKKNWIAANHKQSTIDQFKNDAINLIANLFTDRELSIPVDPASIKNAKNVKEIKTAFLVLINGTLYNVSGDVVTKPTLIEPLNDALPGNLTTAVIKKAANGTYGKIMKTIYKDLPALIDFLFNGISNIKNNETKLREFTPKILLPLFKTLMTILKIDDFPIKIIEPFLNPIIMKIAKLK